jgi:hypothetical protein
MVTDDAADTLPDAAKPECPYFGDNYSGLKRRAAYFTG